MSIESVIFDFNGTLFYDTELHITAWKQFLKGKLGYEISDEEFHQRVFGRDNIQVVRGYFPDLNQETWEAYSEEKEAIYRQMCVDKPELTHLVEGAEAFFDYLKEHEIPFTIATGANKGNVDFYFEEFHLEKWFDYEKVVLDDGHLPGKPDPTVYLLALKKLDMPASTCLVFEDSPAGVRAAHAAGIGKVVVLQKGTDFPEEAAGIVPDFCGAEKFLG